MERIAFSVSHTTRPTRAGEQEGIDYFFVNKETFAAMQQDDFFLEWAEVHGNLYGTSNGAVQTAIEQGIDIVLDIDVKGARQVKKKMGNKGIFIFIAPPSLEELALRLAGRGTDPGDAVATRLANAQDELKSIALYDYVIVNDNLDQAVEVLKAIIIAERSKQRRGFSGEPLNLVF
jgi:guanylate kinase